MADLGPARAFRVLHLTTGGVLLYLSLATMWHALRHVPRGGGDLHVAAMAAVEAVAAGLFVLRGTMRAGALLLLAVLGLAFVLHALRGELAAQLLVYAAVVFYVRRQGGAPATVR